jgi:aspartyl-tRNA(Asn)/glutamyl-tRNA(Gln) amidotransferase subunit C
MRLSIKEVEHIAALARLELSEDEKKRYSEQLSDILAYAARLDDIDTGEITPTASGTTAALRLRPDSARPGLPPENILENAPKTQDGQFKVPPILERE